MSGFEVEVLNCFLKHKGKKALTPSNIDAVLDYGIQTMIGTFLKLESKGLLRWISLNLLELELERSTKEIYDEIYNSSAKLTKRGEIFVKQSKSNGS